MNEQLVNIDKISYAPKRKGYLVLLKSFSDEKYLKVLVGTKAAKEIALAKEGVTLPRPSTHELLLDVINNYEIKLKKIIITDYKSSTFFAKIILFNHNYGNISIDSRPSDAMILSLRAGAPLYINKKILNITLSNYRDNELDSIDNELDSIDNDTYLYSTNELLLEKLNVSLDKAIEFEEYEKAAKLRDEIANLVKSIKAEN